MKLILEERKSSEKAKACEKKWRKIKKEKEGAVEKANSP